MVVELHAGAQRIDERRTLMTERRLDQRHQLRLVPRERAGHEGRAQLQGHTHQINSRVGIDHALLRLRTFVGGGGKLALGQAIDPVILDDVSHVHTAPDGMGKLAKTDGGRVPVAGDAQIDQFPIGQIGTGQHRWHSSVYGIEAVAVAEEIVRSLRRTADARQFGHPVWRQVQLERRLNDRRRD